MVKASVLVSKEKVVVKEFPVPYELIDSALIRIEATGVCGTDPHIFKGTRVGATYPVILGHEICGVVEELGKNYKSISYDEICEGDRITIVPGKPCGHCYYCKTMPHMENLCINRKIYGVTLSSKNSPHLFGGFAEKIVLKQGYWTYKIPKNIPPEVGCLVEPMTVAIRAVERGLESSISYISKGFGIGSNVVIQGSGTIGIFATMAAKILGAKVITLDLLDHRLKMAKKFGASETLNVQNMTSEEKIEEVKKLTKNIGADIVIECTGKLEAFEEGLYMLRRGGKYIEMGNFADIGFSKIKPSYICRNDIEILGSVIAPPQDFRRAIHIIKNFKFPFRELITKIFNIEEVNQAIENVVKLKGIKTVIRG